jgi:hypothetical protein
MAGKDKNSYLSLKDLQELKRLRKPHPVIEAVMEAVMLLEPMPSDGQTGWWAAKRLLSNPRTFMAALLTYPVGQPRCPESQMQRCRELLATLDEAVVKKVSIACCGLYLWAQAVVDDTARVAVAPRAAPPRSPRSPTEAPVRYAVDPIPMGTTRVVGGYADLKGYADGKASPRPFYHHAQPAMVSGGRPVIPANFNPPSRTSALPQALPARTMAPHGVSPLAFSMPLGHPAQFGGSHFGHAAFGRGYTSYG